MKKAMLIAAAVLLATGCATTQPTPSKQCGSFDTKSLHTDLRAPFRTDRAWHETIIAMLAWQLDCERSDARADFSTPNPALGRMSAPPNVTRKPAPLPGFEFNGADSGACGVFGCGGYPRSQNVAMIESNAAVTRRAGRFLPFERPRFSGFGFSAGEFLTEVNGIGGRRSVGCRA
ncbi:MAG: hypothetical protein Q7U97_11740 [Rhodocyclaceae bacterium]|nr:hypothetical protein [Rhodocyclaceae bacterium]